MKYALMTLIALMVVSCGGDTDGDSGQTTDNVTPTTTRSVSSPTSSPLIEGGSPTIDASPSARDDLALALPSVEMAEDILEIGLTEREVRNDLSQAFEGADFSVITDGVVGLYRGTGRDAYAFIDVAGFVDVSAAEAFFSPIREQGDGWSGTREKIEVDGIGDEALGFVGTVPEEPDANIGMVYLRVEDVVSIMVVRQPTDAGLADRMRRLAEVVAVGVAEVMSGS